MNLYDAGFVPIAGAIRKYRYPDSIDNFVLQNKFWMLLPHKDHRNRQGAMDVNRFVQHLEQILRTTPIKIKKSKI